MTLAELQARAIALKKTNDAFDRAQDGDMTEAQVARSNEILEEAEAIKTVLSAQGFSILFREAAETSKHVVAD